MNDTKLVAAFGRYKVKLAKRVRSAITTEGDLVISCWYAGFKRCDVETLRYEEDLSRDSGEVARTLRTHLSEAKADCDVRPIIAVPPSNRKASPAATRAGATYYPREDLVGRLSTFDGERFIIDFRRVQKEPSTKAHKRGPGRDA